MKNIFEGINVRNINCLSLIWPHSTISNDDASKMNLENITYPTNEFPTSKHPYEEPQISIHALVGTASPYHLK
jgi:hypothetical protein